MTFGSGGPSVAAPRGLTSKQQAAVGLLKQWLFYARQANTGYPLFGKNPYDRALQILRKDRGEIPPIWRSRALAQYAMFLATPGWANYKTTKAPKRYLEKAKRLLRESLALSPRYVNGWLRLMAVEYALHHWNRMNRQGSHCLVVAARLDPDNPLVQEARAWQIVLMPGAVHVIPGKPLDPPGNLGFVSAKWRRAFCYRALLYLKYHNAKMEWRVEHVSGVAGLFRAALKFYEPHQLAALEAGKWKPDPAADPWPPKPKPLAKKGTAPAGGGQRK